MKKLITFASLILVAQIWVGQVNALTIKTRQIKLKKYEKPKIVEPTPLMDKIYPQYAQGKDFSSFGYTYILAVKIARSFQINPSTFVCVLEKESGLNSRRPDGSLKCGDGGASCGIGQIQYPTWVSIRKHAGWSTEDLRADDYENMRTTAYGLSTLWKYHWTGYRLCEQEGMSL